MMIETFDNKTTGTFTFSVTDATLGKLLEMFEDVNVKDCPYFDVQDRYGNVSRYYREDAIRSIVERKKGKWIEHKEPIQVSQTAVNYLAYFECSECGAETKIAGKYCAWCGAEMEREE